MGLDVYKYELQKKSADELVLYPKSYDEDTKAKTNLFESLPQEYIHKETEEIHDFQELFSLRKLNHMDWGFSVQYFGDKEDYSDSYYVFVHKKTQEELKFGFNEVPEILEPKHIIKVKETGYQRSGLKQGFKEAHLKKFPEFTGYATVYINSQEALDLIKEWCLPNTPLLEWELKENEIITIDW